MDEFPCRHGISCLSVGQHGFSYRHRNLAYLTLMEWFFHATPPDRSEILKFKLYHGSIVYARHRLAQGLESSTSSINDTKHK